MSEVAIVTCLFNGTKTDVKLPYGAFHYDTSWVDKLYRQVQRNTTYKFDFICLVDEPDYVFHEPVQSVMLNNRRGGWVALTEMYRADITKLPRLTLGLDTLILKNIDDILSYRGFFAVCTDPSIVKNTLSNMQVIDGHDHEGNKPFNLRANCNALTMASEAFIADWQFMWETRKEEILTDEWNHFSGVTSEMMIIRNEYPHADRLDVLYPEKIYSYKHWIADHPEDVTKASVVYYSGQPKQSHMLDKPWVAEAFR